MDFKDSFLIILAIFIFALVGLLIFLFFKSMSGRGNAAVPSNFIPDSSLSSAPDINTLLQRLENQNLSKEELVSLVDWFIDDFTIPLKTGGAAPKEVKAYLNFVYKICSHKNTDAKIITRLTIRAKKKNPDYEKEIDVAESDGIAKFRAS